MKWLVKKKIDLILDSRKAYRKAILDLLEKDSNALYLDLGCGDGTFTKIMASKLGVTRYYGIDTNKLEWEDSRVADLNSPPWFFTPGFNVITASQVIEHLWYTDEFIKEVYRLLIEGGYAIISTPNLASWHNILYLILGKQPETATISDLMYPEKEIPGHRRVFTGKELVKFLEFHGFKVEKVIGTSWFPFTGLLSKLLCKLDIWHSSMITVKVVKL